VDLAQYSDKVERKAAEKEHSRALKEYEKAVKARNQVIKERRKLYYIHGHITLWLQFFQLNDSADRR
jgi:recombinational DNA repair ATPase RecF